MQVQNYMRSYVSSVIARDKEARAEINAAAEPPAPEPASEATFDARV